LLDTILPGIRQRDLPGYRGAYLYRRNTGTEVEFVTTMLFDSLEGVIAFAGPSYEHGVVPETAQKLLTRFDSVSMHYDVRSAPDRV
jgi:hypothetical protein